MSETELDPITDYEDDQPDDPPPPEVPQQDEPTPKNEPVPE